MEQHAHRQRDLRDPTVAVLRAMQDGYVRLYTVPEAAAILRIGRSVAYELARRFEATSGTEGLPVIRLGNRTLRVPADALDDLIVLGRLRSA